MGASQPLWYENAFIYQVDTALLRDTDGNGFGDLAGVTESLEHIKRLGATAIWLQPFYVSPFVDGGYDIVDHTAVSDRYGTRFDFEELIARAEEIGLAVIVDLVVQHTSTAHPWFSQARRDRRSRYRHYYVWTDEPHDTVVEPVFPTVHDTVWTYDERAGQYYRHAFYDHEPDLDVGHPDVRAEIHRIMRHWLDLGVAGFRVDAVPYMVAQAKLTDPTDDGFWFLEELRAVVTDRRPDGVLIGEADVPADEYAWYFGDGDRLPMVLNFWLNNNLFLALARGDAEPLARALRKQPAPPPGCQYATWLRNHDELDLEQLSADEREEVMAAFAPEPRMQIFGRGIRRRLAPMLVDPRRVRLARALLCALPGSPVLLYGDEIGMGENLDLPDRAPVRSPMQWDDGENAGFSRAHPTRLVAPLVDEGPFGYEHVNVVGQERQPESPLRTLRHLVETRRRLGPFRADTCETIPVDHPAVFLVVHGDGTHRVVMVHNLSDQTVDATIPDALVSGLEEVAADHEYQPAGRSVVHLSGYGFRWFSAASA